MSSTILRPLIATAFALLLTACGPLVERPEPPRVSLVNLQLTQMTLFEQRFHLELRLQNPNAYPLPLAGMEYTIELNGERFADGVSNDRVTIPEFGEALIAVDVSSDLASLLRQLYRLQRGEQPTLSYRLHGSVGIVDQAFKLPFERSGEITLQPAPRGGEV
ncbi:MAG: LEA type 2 family protein [Chromatiales bacterium]|jgi:LEA14-like dessication related protein